jgi:alpha-ketoglutarate-dependent taurine dioxygenase
MMTADPVAPAVVSVAPDGSFEPADIAAGRALPLVLEAPPRTLPLVSFLTANAPVITSELGKHGAILFRGFEVEDVRAFEDFAAAVSGPLMEYQERATPRTLVQGRVYSSTDYPPPHRIFFHNESSFALTWPLKLFFYCLIAPQRGGETPLADTRRVLARLDPQVRSRFVEKGVMYVRNFGGRFGLPWHTAFQTADRKEVEDLCRQALTEVEWVAGDRLRTVQVRPAIASHPHSGEHLWFNHVAVFHVSTLPRPLRDPLLKLCAEEDLPTNSYYGDGSAIEPWALDVIRTAYEGEAAMFSWRENDVLLVDNMLTAHGRMPYAGRRRIVVAMAEPTSRDHRREDHSCLRANG